MKYINKIFTIIGLFFVVALLVVFNQQSIEITTQKAAITLTQPTLKEAIQKGFQAGNVAILFPYFDEFLNICIEDKEAIYLAYDAQVVMQNFFTKYPPATFKISHSGKSRGGKEAYFIGDYTDENDNKLRIYIFVEAALIQEVEISNKMVSS